MKSLLFISFDNMVISLSYLFLGIYLSYRSSIYSQNKLKFKNIDNKAIIMGSLVVGLLGWLFTILTLEYGLIYLAICIAAPALGLNRQKYNFPREE